jgi:hypothetical protein
MEFTKVPTNTHTTAYRYVHKVFPYLNYIVSNLHIRRPSGLVVWDPDYETKDPGFKYIHITLLPEEVAGYLRYSSKTHETTMINTADMTWGAIISNTVWGLRSRLWNQRSRVQIPTLRFLWTITLAHESWLMCTIYVCLSVI